MLITQTNYERIYKTINSLLLNEGSDPSVACIFFTAFGGWILKQHFGIDTRPQGGLAAYRLDDDVLIFGEKTENGFTGDGEGFHCWLEADGWVIDFMAPAWPQLKNTPFQIPAKMFQKRKSDMSESLDGLSKSGDFFLAASGHSTMKHMQIVTSRPAYGDLADIASLWFQKHPKKMRSEIAVGDSKGKVKNVLLTGNRLVGTW
ncbi:DUF2026 family protein [Rhizobium rhododendri]|uniref:DUF2026 family protein n=1 Tax=Rhizobium rhododendri TaxID=2506430 RepID=A0ABY8IKN5_9HYPH|nr:DUF2026 family protein [Rhizobium rhododendri]WFS23933.1 DUF2026 family protein [Rhizobium rhododendri]